MGFPKSSPEQRHDLLEIVEDRYGRGATPITSRPSDAILDRIETITLIVRLSGDSLRKQKAPKIGAA